MRCPPVPDPQPPLQQGSARLAELEYQPHGIIEQLGSLSPFSGSPLAPLGLLSSFSSLGPSRKPSHILGFALCAPEFRHGGNLLLRYERRMNPHQPRSFPEGGKAYRRVPTGSPHRFESMIVRESTLVARRKLIRVGTLALISPVMTSTTRPLRRQDQVNPHRASHLGETGNRLLYVRPVQHHQIRQARR